MRKIIIWVVVLCFLFTGVNIYRLMTKDVAPKIDGIQVDSLLPQYNLEDLTNDSELIISGVVVEISDAKWNNIDNKKPEKITGKDTIYRDVTLKVDSIIKGDVSSGSHVTIRTLGGAVDNFKMEDDSQPELNKGDEVIAFLLNDNTIYNKEKTKDHFIVLGSEQGIYKLSGNEISNSNEKLKLDEFMQKTKSYLLNPKPKINVKSEE